MKGAKIGAGRRVAVAGNQTNRRSRTCSESRVAAKHRDAGTILGASERDHMLPNVASNRLAVVSARTGQDVLDKIVAKLITRNCMHVRKYAYDLGIDHTHCR